MGDRGHEEGFGDLVDRLIIVGKDQSSVARVGLEDFFEDADLGGGAQRDLAMAAVGVHGAAARRALGREYDEIASAVGGAQAVVLVGEKGLVFVAGGLVMDALLGDHLHLAALDRVFGEIFAGELFDPPLVGDGTNQ